MGRRYLGGSGEPLTVWISVSVNSEPPILVTILDIDFLVVLQVQSWCSTDTTKEFSEM
jgi:hypothetical protein